MSLPAAGRNTSKPRFTPALIAQIEARAGRLELKANTFLSILVHNDLVAPAPMKLREGRAERTGEKRVPFPLSLPLNLRRDGNARAVKAGGNFTAYLEELATRNITAGGPLLVLELEK